MGTYRSGGLLRDLSPRLTWLSVLRALDGQGPLAARELFAVLRSLQGWSGMTPPSYPLLHDLVARGLLEADRAQPPRYRITTLGRQEGARLQQELLPVVRCRLAACREDLVTLFGAAVLEEA